MFPFWYNSLYPYLKNYQKSILLHQKDIRFITDGDGHIERINDYLDLLGNNSAPFAYVDNIRAVPQPVPKLTYREVEKPTNLDIKFNDNNRNYYSIKERYHKDYPSIVDLRPITDPSTRQLLPMTRGGERSLLTGINYMDDEALMYFSKKPSVD